MTETTSVFIRVGSDTAQKWERICAGYSTKTAAFTALVENYYWSIGYGEDYRGGRIGVAIGENDEQTK